MDKKLNNLLSFTEHSDKDVNRPAKKTKRTDVAKDILESKRTKRTKRTERTKREPTARIDRRRK